MRTHPDKGEAICRPMKCLNPVLPIIRSHHERWDGSGYPDGFAGHKFRSWRECCNSPISMMP